jgi:hypothetical protein
MRRRRKHLQIYYEDPGLDWLVRLEISYDGHMNE